MHSKLLSYPVPYNSRASVTILSLSLKVSFIERIVKEDIPLLRRLTLLNSLSMVLLKMLLYFRLAQVWSKFIVSGVVIFCVSVLYFYFILATKKGLSESRLRTITKLQWIGPSRQQPDFLRNMEITNLLQSTISYRQTKVSSFVSVAWQRRLV